MEDLKIDEILHCDESLFIDDDEGVAEIVSCGLKDAENWFIKKKRKLTRKKMELKVKSDRLFQDKLKFLVWARRKRDELAKCGDTEVMNYKAVLDVPGDNGEDTEREELLRGHELATKTRILASQHVTLTFKKREFERNRIRFYSKRNKFLTWIKRREYILKNNYINI